MTKLIHNSVSANRMLIQRLRRCRPDNRRQLAAYVRAFLGLSVPDQRICPDHNCPMDYLAYAFLGEKNQETNSAAPAPAPVQESNHVAGTSRIDPRLHGNDYLECDSAARRDILVWANRGGGKTQLGAIASLLEGIFLPGCQIRILGGCEEQSQKMYGYLRQGLSHGFDGLITGHLGSKGCRFKNGSAVQVLAQSHSSVRGHHVQRLRCDEVELFDPDVWQAAQLITHSSNHIPARIEALSTMHRPFGLMKEIIDNLRQNAMRLFRWCLWEVIEPCRDRRCSACVLWSDCRGRAKNAVGYYPIDDAVSQKRRTSSFTWQAEMLCRQPNRQEIVFAEFNPTRHVRSISYNANLPLFRTIDFGFSNPLVCLFLQVDNDDNVYVIDEHLKSRTTLAEHARLIKQRYPCPVAATYCDPAGRQRNEITGTSCVTELAALGLPTQSRPSHINDGINLIRDFLAPADGKTRLLISNKCPHLIRAFQGLHYHKQPNGALSELPEKDGVHDHLIDALRYFFVNHFGKKYALNEIKY